MQPILILHNSYGLPLCVSAITHRFALSLEIRDHDRRREAMKKQRTQARERFLANRDMGNRRNFAGDLEEIIKEGKVAGDLHDLCFSSMCCTAKAA